MKVGSLFWTDYADGTINFVQLNGHFDPVAANHGSKTGRFLTLYDRGIWPNQIIADPNFENKIGEYSYNGMLYWIDGGKRTIEQIDYIGNNHRVLLPFKHFFNVNGNSVPAYGLALHNDQLFFSPWYQQDGKVYAIARDGSSDSITEISRGISQRPFSMAIVFDYMQEKQKGKNYLNYHEDLKRQGGLKKLLCFARSRFV